MLTLLAELEPQLPGSEATENVSAALATIRKATVNGIEPSVIRVHLFEWSSLSLGWYESLLWSFIFASEMLVSKGTTGVWNGSLIKLFRVQEMAAQTPSLLAPRGAVDAVGSNLVNRIGSLSLRGGPTARGPNSSSAGGNSNNSHMTAREV
jgi:High-temperature-induced dauer-formation protein